MTQNYGYVPPTVALPLTPAGLKTILTHPPPTQLPLPTDEGVPRTDTFTPLTTRDEGVADTQQRIPNPPLDSNDTREPSTRPEGVDNTKDHTTATSRLEGVTNLDFNKQDSADGIPTTSLRIRGGGPKSKGPGTRASRLGLFLSPGLPEATTDPADVSVRPTATDPATVDPTVLPSLFEIGTSSSAAVPPVFGTTSAAPPTSGASSSPLFGDSPSPTVPPDYDSLLGTPPSPLTSCAIAPTIGFGAAPMPTHVETVAPASTTPPERTLLDELRESSAEHELTLSTLTSDLREHINKSRDASFAHRDSLDRIALDLRASDADRHAQREATDRTIRSNREATESIALDLRSSSRVLDNFRDEVKALFAEMKSSQHPQPANLPEGTEPTTAETQPLPFQPGASRFTIPLDRGRPLRDATRQPSRLTHPCHPASTSSPRGALETPSYRAADTSILTSTKTNPPRQPDTSDRHGKIGINSPSPRDKSHATYCRKLDVSSMPDSRKALQLKTTLRSQIGEGVP